MNAVVYTCITAGYDSPFSPVQQTKNCRFVLFAEKKPTFLKGWEWRPLPEETLALDPPLKNRYCKFFPHLIFNDVDISIYIDGNILVRNSLTTLINGFQESGADIGLFQHPIRSSIFEEVEACYRLKKFTDDDKAAIRAQLYFYRSEGLLKDHLLSENGILFRNQRSEKMAAAMQLWWDQILNFTRRDQISLPYVLHKLNLAVHVWSWSYRSKNPFFYRYPHQLSSFSRTVGNFVHVKALYGPVNKAFFGPLDFLYRRLVYIRLRRKTAKALAAESASDRRMFRRSTD